MKKKRIIALLLVALLLLLCACSSKDDTTDTNQPADTTDTTDTTQQDDTQDSDTTESSINKKVALILQQGGLGDQGFNDTAYEGLLACQEQYDLDINYVECTDATQGETLIRELC